MSLFLKGFFPDFSLPLDSGDGWVKMATNYLVCKMCKWICKLILYPLSSLSKEMTPLSGPLFREDSLVPGSLRSCCKLEIQPSGHQSSIGAQSRGHPPEVETGKQVFPSTLRLVPQDPGWLLFLFVTSPGSWRQKKPPRSSPTGTIRHVRHVINNPPPR